MQQTTDGTAALLQEWDGAHAYPAARQLEKAWRLPDGYCALHFPNQHQASSDAVEHTWHAILLSGGNLDACRALLRGERVPTDKIERRYLTLNQRRAA